MSPACALSISACSVVFPSPQEVRSCHRKSPTSGAILSIQSSTWPMPSRGCGGSNTAIKRALLDQQLVSGIGNIYADEALWVARMHYARPIKTLSRAQAAGVITPLRRA